MHSSAFRDPWLQGMLWGLGDAGEAGVQHLAHVEAGERIQSWVMHAT
jgi:hypothetical protein